MVFTLDDAEDEGKIKREISAQLAGVANRENPEWFGAFENVCRENGQDPGTVLADMAVRAINDDQYASEILDTEVNRSVLETGENRIEDAKQVMEVADELGLNESSDSMVDKIIERRLEATASSPFDEIDRNKNGGGGNSGANSEEVKQLRRQVQQLQQRLEQERAGAEEESDSGGGAAEDAAVGDGEPEVSPEIEDLFDSDEPTDEPEETKTEESESRSAVMDVPSEGGEVEVEPEMGEPEAETDEVDEMVEELGDVDEEEVLGGTVEGDESE